MKHKSRRSRKVHKKKYIKNRKTKNMRKSQIVRSKKMYKKYSTGTIFIGGVLAGQSIVTDQRCKSLNKFFVMRFPEKDKFLEHSKIFDNMLAINSNIERNSITSCLRRISTIIIDGDFAKNDCDDMWALAYLSKNISKVNVGQEPPILICGSLDGAVDMRSVIANDTNIDRAASGHVQTRHISGLYDTVLIYILGGVDDSEVASYIKLMTNNTAAMFCFIFQSPPQWKLDTADKHPSNVRAGYGNDELPRARAAIDNYITLLEYIIRNPNAIVVFTDFERTKRVYTIKYEFTSSESESTINNKPFVMVNIDAEQPVGADPGKQELLDNYIDSLSPTYTDYHKSVDSYKKLNPNAKFIKAIGENGILIKYGSYIADLYTVYASLCNDDNIVYESIAGIEHLVKI